MASAGVAVQDRPGLAHSARTAVTAVISLAVARLFSLPEAYWAPITTLVIVQTSLDAALKVSRERLIGTALGSLVGAIMASYFTPKSLLFGAGVFVLGLLCAAAKSDRPAYRFAGISLAIVFLVPRADSAWRVAFHRFAEVAIGIVVALLMTLAWPESEPKST